MPKIVIDNRKGEDKKKIQEIIDTSMFFSEFAQYVQNDIPYDNYVFGVGKVKYTPCPYGSQLVLIPDDGTDMRKNLWYWGGTTFNGFSLYKSWQSFDQYNDFYWRGANGKLYWQEILHPDVNGKYTKNGYGGLLKSSNSAFAKAKPLYKVAKGLNCIALIIPVGSSIYNGNVSAEDGVDFAFAAVGFVPGIGWVVSGIYTVTDAVCVITTGDKLVTYAEKKGITKWVEFQNQFNAWINNMSY